jgi:hypothetical protein
MSDDKRNPEKVQFEEDAFKLKKQQDKVKYKYDFLKNTTPKYFQAEYVKAQAEEICNYIKTISLTPFNPWYSTLIKLVSEGEFMSTYYLTYNEYDIIVPDYERIKTLILPDPTPDEFPRSIIL